MKVVRDNDCITIYTNNCVTKELVEEVKLQCSSTTELVSVSFNVIGRTRHLCLAHELVGELGDGYEAIIDYDMYWCKIKRKDA